MLADELEAAKEGANPTEHCRHDHEDRATPKGHVEAAHVGAQGDGDTAGKGNRVTWPGFAWGRAATLRPVERVEAATVPVDRVIEAERRSERSPECQIVASRTCQRVFAGSQGIGDARLRERFGEGLERRERLFRAAAQKDGGAACERRGGEVVGQPRLADPRLACDEHDPPIAMHLDAAP